MQNRLVAGATVLIVFIVVLAIVATVLVLRTKNQDDLDKKTSNHLPLPLDYASNEGLLSVFAPLNETPAHFVFFHNFSCSREKERFKIYKLSFTCIMRI